MRISEKIWGDVNVVSILGNMRIIRLVFSESVLPTVHAFLKLWEIER
jgi:hypothetical protein